MKLHILEHTPYNLSLVKGMQDVVIEQVAPEVFYPAGELDWELYFSGKGTILLAEVDDVPAGYAISIIGEDAIGELLHITNEMAVRFDIPTKDLMWLDATLVMPGFRGRGLQVEMCSRLEEMARDKGSKGALAIVSPVNQFSLNNFIHRGYEVVDEVEMFGGLPRLVLYCPLTTTSATE